MSVNEDRFGTGEWRVEYFDDDGGCYITIFAGPAAERRARDYFISLKSGRLRWVRADSTFWGDDLIISCMSRDEFIEPCHPPGYCPFVESPR